MAKRLMCTVVALAALTACGGSDTNTPSGLCNKAVSTGSSLDQKLTACYGSNAPSSGLPTDSQTCQTQITQCSSSDQAILNTFLDCVNGLPACTDSTFQSKAADCSAPLSGLSSACTTALGITP